MRTNARREAQSKIEALEQKRRGLIAALVQIDQEIAKERALQATPPPPPLFTPDGSEEVFGADGDLESGD